MSRFELTFVGSVNERPYVMILVFMLYAIYFASHSRASEQFDAQTIEFFETDIRPLLAENCFSCHSARAKKLKGGLRLDHRTSILEGGESGPVLVPGKPAVSPLMEAVRYEGLEMPPDRKLSEANIARLEKWIKLGAPFPGGAESEDSTREAFRITEEDRNYWAYKPIVKPELPTAENASWNQHPIDQLVYARLHEKALSPNPSATPRQLIRRLYFDLIGLPPSPDQIELFERNPFEDAFAELIDHLLSLPQYGERWGRHWLDIVRFAQSNGYERDDEKPLVWRYRDYVIKSFNDDKPFDRFVMEQLAGDELPDADAESVMGTGFYRLGVWDDEPDDKRAAEFDGLDDMLSTVGQVFLGQTLGCARCHDHMFDPIAQTDYYEMLSFVRNVKYYDTPTYNLSSATYAPLASPKDVAEFAAEQQTRIALLEKTGEATENEEERKEIEKAIQRILDEKGPFEDWTLAIREHGSKPKETFVLIRGDAGTPGERVEPRFLSVLGNQAANTPTPSHDMSCGLRTQLAGWVASPQNPLTARVISNRLWQYHFGRGIVRTPNDLGKAGVPPTHPELLDWLAAELIENNWSIKHLHKQILLSRTWQMSSESREGKAADVDPDNNLFWRQNLRRLDAEAIRDSMLFVSGKLNTNMGGRGFFPNLSSEVLAGQSKPGWGWGVSEEEERNRRSVYIFTKRGVRDPLIETFDYVNTTSPLGVRPVTTIAPQALVLLNGRFVQRQALALAERVSQDGGSLPKTSIDKIYRLALGRHATESELKTASEYLARQEAEFASVESITTFRPDVPDALKTDYRKLLPPEAYVIGPRETWNYHPGKWVGGYEAIDALDENRVPFMFWTGAPFKDAEVTGKLMLHNATRFASLLLNGSAEGELFSGVEIRLDPGTQRVYVYQHDKDGFKEVASAPWSLLTSRWIEFRLAVTAAKAQFWLDNEEQPVLEFPVDEVVEDAKFGVAVNRGAMSFDDFGVTVADRAYDVATYKTKITPTKLKALQSLCVVLMNTNEFLYVD